MPHPTEDVRPNGTCRVCGDQLSAPIRRRGVTKIYVRHLNNPNCSTKGRGEPINPQPRRTR
jgi:ssDNA-binding Zn-finger/Zn-ribbon topoisomerase 1